MEKISNVITQCPNLTNIDLSHNYLQGSFVCNAKNLQTLELEGNPISNIEIQSSTLYFLNISETNIVEISSSFLNLISLQWSNIKYGHCSIYYFDQLTKIQNLQFCNNEILIPDEYLETNNKNSYFEQKLSQFKTSSPKLNFWRSFPNDSKNFLKNIFPKFKF
jgi:hypothetical protein